MKRTQRAKWFLSDIRPIGAQAARLWRLLGPRQQQRLGGVLGLMALVGAATAAIPVLLGRLVDEMVAGRLRSLGGAGGYLVGVAVLYLLREALQVVRKVRVERTCTTVEKEVRVQLVTQLLRYDLAALGTERVGALHGRLHRSIEGLIRSLKLAYLELFPAAFIAVFSLAAVLRRRLDLGLLMAAVVPLGAWIVTRQLASQRGVRLDLLRTKETMDGMLVEQLGGIEYVRAADTYRHEGAKVERISEQLRWREMRHHVAMALYDCAKALNEGGFHVAVIAYAIGLAVRGAISIGDILSFSVLFTALLNPLREVHRILDEAHEASLRVADLLAMLDHPVDTSFATAATHPPRLSVDVPLIEAEGLRVEYRGAGERGAGLAGVSLTIRHGEMLGVAGPSGSGKSTLLRAVLRLVHPAGGSLRLGGVPIAEVSRGSIGRLIGFVSQTPFLFSGTIEDNIAYGCADASREAIVRAARLARIDDEIRALPEGYQTLVTERGQNLSGGQRQRLALARVFLQDPPILILDEATAALDNLNERRVLDALEAARAGRTVILVAHRLSTLRRADRIVVFDSGQIIEAGTYDQLARQGGLFSRLLLSSGEGGDAASGSAA